MRRTPDRPKVALPKASQPNEILSIDLKEMKDDNLHILFITDEFTRYTRGQVIKTKQPEMSYKPLKPTGSYKVQGGQAKGSSAIKAGSSAIV